MRSKGMRLVAALGVMLGASLPAAAAGQAVPVWEVAAPRPALEAFYTRVGYGDAPAGGGTVRVGGLGGRVMWPLAASPEAGSWLARHAAVGVFGAYTPKQELGFSAGQFGLAADVVPLGAPIAGRVEPFVSLGAGALRTTTSSRATPLRPTVRPELPVARADAAASARGHRSSTNFLLVPGVGARVRVRPGVAVQGDLRNLVTFRGDARRHHHAFGTGVRLTF